MERRKIHHIIDFMAEMWIIFQLKGRIPKWTDIAKFHETDPKMFASPSAYQKRFSGGFIGAQREFQKRFGLEKNIPEEQTPLFSECA